MKTVSRIRSLKELNRVIADCRLCPRLVEYREAVARERRRMFRDWVYWGRPVPGFGDPAARILVVGLAPAAHGGNRTGRIFTGDRSGDWLYRTLYRFGFAKIPTSVSVDDGQELRDVYITAAAHCAPPENRPTREEFQNCRPYLMREIQLLKQLQITIALGAMAFDQVLAACAALGEPIPRPRPKFGHGVSIQIAGFTLLGCYHPSQRNTQTGFLTEEMFDGIFERARSLLQP